MSPLIPPLPSWAQAAIPMQRIRNETDRSLRTIAVHAFGIVIGDLRSLLLTFKRLNIRTANLGANTATVKRKDRAARGASGDLAAARPAARIKPPSSNGRQADAQGRQGMGQQKSGHVTLLDIARASGFSVSTVSIVLSEAPLSQNVAATTREHIRTIARQLGYHPDAYARSLRRRSTQTIGVLAFDLSDPFCTPIMRGIQGSLRAAGYLPLIVDAQAQRKLFDSSLHMILERRADGVIVIASWVFEEANLLADVKKNNVPIAIIGRDLVARDIDSILVDNEAGGAMAARH